MSRHNLKITDTDLGNEIRLYGIASTAKKFKISEREVYRRRNKLEAITGEPVRSPLGPGGVIKQTQAINHRIPITIPNGVVIVASDAHYWPGPPPFMHRALIHFLNRFREERKLKAIIANGDMLDFAAISRWPLINWEKQPEAKDEIETAQERLGEIAKAAGRVPKLWPGGNHDIRFNKFIAEHAKELAGIQGMHLKDFFGAWEPCWSVLINENTIIKHRIRGGIYAVRNNVLATGIHTITSHLHQAMAFPVTNLRGTLWGVDTGCIAEVASPQFLYTEDNPKNWREAFAILTYKDGNLMPPELVIKCDDNPGCVTFRGDTVRI